MSLTVASKVYKPFKYPWAYKFWLTQQQVHWLPTEVPMGGDVADFNKLAPEMRSLIVNIFRMFVQADIDVHHSYHSIYARIFKPTEVSMMLTAFQNMETVHIAAYSTLLDTLGFPETEYHAFLEYEAMRKKHEWMHSFNPTNPTEVALSLAGVSGFGEGLALFASFAMLLNFPRQNLLKGMGQIISWSVRDESLHCEGIARLFHAYLAETDDVDRSVLAERIPADRSRGRRQRGRLHRPGVPGRRRARSDRCGGQALHSLHRRHPAAPARAGPDLWHRRQPPAVDRRHAGGHRAREFFEAQGTEYSKAATQGDWLTPSRTVAAPTFNHASKCVINHKLAVAAVRHKQLTECMQNDTHESRTHHSTGGHPVYVGFERLVFAPGVAMIGNTSFSSIQDLKKPSSYRVSPRPLTQKEPHSIICWPALYRRAKTAAATVMTSPSSPAANATAHGARAGAIASISRTSRRWVMAQCSSMPASSSRSPAFRGH
jgi:ribonucleoside-diphosphate reductase beta chain